MTTTPAALILPRYVHLKVHSAYSLLEGALPIAKLAKLADAAQMPALALTDTNNMFGCLEFADKLAGAGIQPITGLSLAVDFGDQAASGPAAMASKAASPLAPPHRDGLLALYAMNEAGYANLMKLASDAHLETRDGEAPHVKLANLVARAKGLIVLTGGPDGPINRPLVDGNMALADARLHKLAAAFGDRLYVELQRHRAEPEKIAEPHLLDLAYEHGLPIVATNECYFAKADDFEAHDVLPFSSCVECILPED